jgi:hypothetical protein
VEILEETTLELELMEISPPFHREIAFEHTYEEPQISLHALSEISSPQTLKLMVISST